MARHGHSFFYETSDSSNHRHVLEGITSFSQDKKDHRHYIRGITSDDKVDSHSFYILSSWEIPLKDGGHTHCIEGFVEDKNGHSHYVKGVFNPY